jgi:hypothetical protein
MRAQLHSRRGGALKNTCALRITYQPNEQVFDSALQQESGPSQVYHSQPECASLCASAVLGCTVWQVVSAPPDAQMGMLLNLDRHALTHEQQPRHMLALAACLAKRVQANTACNLMSLDANT